MKFLLLALFHNGDIAYHKEFNDPEKLHGAWYYWSNCVTTEGRRKYKVSCYKLVDTAKMAAYT